MTTTYTTNKNLAVPGITDSGWGATLNTYNFPNSDAAFGALQNISVTTFTGTITLVSSYPPGSGSYSYVPLINYITGTPSGAVTIVIPSGVGGQFIFWNQTGASTPTITIASGYSGTTNSVVIPNGSRVTVYSDGSNIYLADDGLVAQGLTNLTISNNTILNSGFSGSTIIYGDTNHTGTTTVAATSLVAGTAYTIYTVGTTNWTLVGAANNNAGTNFVATGAGTGTGVATTATATLRVAGSIATTGAITPLGVITPRIASITTAATITPTSATADVYEVSALASNTTIAAPSGSPVDGQKLILRFKSNSTGGYTFTWTTTSGGYRIIGTTLPTTIVASKTIYVGCIWNAADNFWDVVAVGAQA